MSLRWYKGFSYKGNPIQLVEQISKQVLQHNLSKFVPLVRLEKGAKGKTFYFFIAIESSQLGEIPSEVKSNLLQLPFFHYGIKGNPCLKYEEIKNMVGANHYVKDYTNPIPYQLVEKVIYDNPFELAPHPISQSSADIEALSHRYERLLYWLSAFGSGTWESFKKACDALKLEEPKRISRRLKLLGHIEFSPDGQRWCTAPIALVKVRSDSDSEKFILCGQRSINLLRKLEQYATIEVSKQPRGEAPPCISLQIEKSRRVTDIVKEISSEFAIANAGEVSSQLATILPDLASWKQSLRGLQGIVPSLYEWKRFDGNDFVSCISPCETGMYQMWAAQTGVSASAPEEQRSSCYTVFYEQDSNRWLQGDWYGLRFLALQHERNESVVQYDPASRRLAIPVSQRWPEIYERALVLASGLLPIYQGSWLLYENVGLELVQQLSNKLNVKSEEASTRA